jgi:glycosyltransferase involved in cell wall biosynthesis
MSSAMNHGRPSISVGVPVRNGAQFLAETLDSLLAQSYPDFELIISDNASTDQTEAICREYAARDPRIRYYRSQRDLGLAQNYNFLFEMARGKYFRWAAADDVCKPHYLQRCLEALEHHPEVALAYTKVEFIDENGSGVPGTDPGFDLRSDEACERLRYVILAGHWVNAIFGLIRIDALRRTRLLPKYPGGDYTFLGELALEGKFFEVPEALFLRRLHPGASSQNRNNVNWVVHLWTGARQVSLPFWSRSRDHFTTILRSQLTVWEKLSLWGSVLRTMISGRRRLVAELGAASLQKWQIKS